MTALSILLPLALGLGLLALIGFGWSLRGGQYEDLEGAAQRILFEDLSRKEPKP
jgi:cbb3-type cytochrome oxidase maturation protein